MMRDINISVAAVCITAIVCTFLIFSGDEVATDKLRAEQKVLADTVGEMDYSLQNRIASLENEVLNLKDAVNDLYQRVEDVSAIALHESHVRFTHYLPTHGGGKEITALGRKALPGRTVAVSRKMAAKSWLGRKVYIPGVGVRVVEDLMSKHVKGNAIDICVPDKTKERGVFTSYITTID